MTETTTIVMNLWIIAIVIGIWVLLGLIYLQMKRDEEEHLRATLAVAEAMHQCRVSDARLIAAVTEYLKSAGPQPGPHCPPLGIDPDDGLPL